MKQVKSYIGTFGMLAVLTAGPVAYAADPAGTGSAIPGEKSATDSGTIEGEVKNVERNAVTIEKESTGKDGGKEVRLPLSESAHKGEVKEGDKVEAFVTPGGTTTSVQPRKGGLNR